MKINGTVQRHCSSWRRLGNLGTDLELLGRPHGIFKSLGNLGTDLELLGRPHGIFKSLGNLGTDVALPGGDLEIWARTLSFLAGPTEFSSHLEIWARTWMDLGFSSVFFGFREGFSLILFELCAEPRTLRRTPVLRRTLRHSGLLPNGPPFWIIA
jgi:hypothetical protein